MEYEDICPDCNEWKGDCTCSEESLSTEEIFGITYGDN
jgi:hypothetical protein